MTQVTRHAQGSLTQLCQFFGKPIPAGSLVNATLNQKFTIFPDTHAVEGTYPIAKLFCIGNGGASGSMTSGTLSIKEIPHLTRHAALYNHLPFIIRPIDNDLTDRTPYRLRKIIDIRGDSYIAYYAKVINLADTSPVLELRNINAGVVTVTPFTHTSGDLTPTQPVIGVGEAIAVGNDYIAASALITFAMTATERDEFKAACDLIYNEEGHSNIFELAIASCTDFTANASGVIYTEASDAQILSSIATSLPMKSLNSGVSVTINVAVVDGLLTVVSI